MKQFSLEEYLKNPDRKVITREGRPVRIICTDKLGATPVVALFSHADNQTELVFSYTTDGKVCGGSHKGSSLDLVFAPIKHEGWVNVYEYAKLEHLYCACIYSTYEDAVSRGKIQSGYITTTKIEWEE
mgnify:CR=1 FL=1